MLLLYNIHMKNFQYQKKIGFDQSEYNVIRSRLHVDIDDCISCRMCERACPVDCIKIEDVKAKKGVEFDYGQTSNDTQKKLLVTRFTIDMTECVLQFMCIHVQRNAYTWLVAQMKKSMKLTMSLANIKEMV